MNQNNLNFLKRPWQFEDHNDTLDPENHYASSIPLDQVGWNDWPSNHFSDIASQDLVQTVDQNEQVLSPFTPMVHDDGGISSLVMPPVVETQNTCFGTVRNNNPHYVFTRTGAYND